MKDFPTHTGVSCRQKINSVCIECYLTTEISDLSSYNFSSPSYYPSLSFHHRYQILWNSYLINVPTPTFVSPKFILHTAARSEFFFNGFLLHLSLNLCDLAPDFLLNLISSAPSSLSCLFCLRLNKFFLFAGPLPVHFLHLVGLMAGSFLSFRSQVRSHPVQRGLPDDSIQSCPPSPLHYFLS